MDNKIKRITGFMAAFLVSAGLLAQTSRNLSIDDAIRLSLQNSNQLKLSSVKVQNAAAVLKEARDNRLPELSISGAYLRLNQPNVDLKLKLPSSQNQGNAPSEEEPNTTSAVTVDQAAYLMANASLPVFSGFRIQYGIESAKYLLKAAGLDEHKDRQELISDAIYAYSNLYKAEKAVELVRENLKQSRQRVKDFSSMEQNGLMARNDLLKARLQESNVELALLDAENNRKLANIHMNLMLGLPQDTQLQPDSAFFISARDNTGYPEWENLALENRDDLKALEYRKKAANAGLKSAKGGYFPTLALTGGYVAAEVPNLLTVTNAINIGAGLSYNPSALWKNGAKVSQAKARLNELTINQDILNDAVRLEVAQAYQNYLSGLKKIEVYQKAVEQAQENYRIVYNKYQNALATATELLDADVAQLQANLNFVFAKADALVSYKRLQQTAGVLNFE